MVGELAERLFDGDPARSWPTSSPSTRSPRRAAASCDAAWAPHAAEGGSEGVTPHAARVLLTYLVHSTVLLGVAALRVASCLARAPPRPARGRCCAPRSSAASRRPASRSGSTCGRSGARSRCRRRMRLPSSRPRPLSSSPVAGTNARDAAAPGVWRGRPVAVSSLPPWATDAVAALTRHWKTGLAAAWAALALVALARLAVAGFRLRRVLRDRRRLSPGELDPGTLLAAHALGLHRPVLSEVRQLSVPLATGACCAPRCALPPRALGDLGADEQVALCAHELAHLARRDPAWVLLARLVEAIAPFQPLNTWARRRLADLAECLSDDLAASASGRPTGLARSLVDVASWTIGERPFLSVAASGALSVRSRLGHRVERLMDPARTFERPRRALLPVAAIVVLATALVTPVVSGSAAPQDKPAPKAQPAQPSQPSRPAQPSQPTPPDAPSPADAEEQIQALTQQIEARSHLHEADMKALEAEIQAIASKIQPREAEMQALGQEIEKAARALAEAVTADLATGAGRKSQQTADAARQLAEVEEQVRAATRDIRIPSEEIRALTEKARALAELSRPTDEEMRQIRRLSGRRGPAGSPGGAGRHADRDGGGAPGPRGAPPERIDRPGVIDPRYDPGVPPPSVEVFLASLKRCLAAPGFLDSFYERFIASSEEVREKFKDTDVRRQVRALEDSLYVVAVAVQGEEGSLARQALPAIAARHGRQDRDIPPHLFDLWIECLVETVRAYDPPLTPDVEAAWRETLTFGANDMKEHR